MKKFDFVIGNPPYQEDVQNLGDRANPIYDKFMDAAYSVGKSVEMIHPARFLFNAGQTPKIWNAKMLADPHFKVMLYEQKSGNIFSNTDIKGGVAITYRDSDKYFGSIGTFTVYEELNSMLNKVHHINDGCQYFDSLVSSQGIYRFTSKALEDHPEIIDMSGKGTGMKIVSSVVEKLPNVFLKDEFYNSIKMLVRNTTGRFYRYIRSDYLEPTEYTNMYKVIVPEANGSGAIGEVLSTPLIGEPLIGVTDTFLCIGPFNTKEEAEAANKYIKTKFARTMLGVNKITQHNPKSTWKDVPLQDFKETSDIDWSKPIPEIDKQLYQKYGLSNKEITFIETHVQEMN